MHESDHDSKGDFGGLDRFVGEVTKTAGVIAGVFILGLMLLVAFDVIGRYILNQPIPGTLEISESAAVFMAFFAFAWAQRRHRHIRIEMAIQYFPSRARQFMDVVALFFGLFVFACIAWLALKSGLSSWAAREYSTGIVRFPLYPGKLAVPLGAALACLQYVTEIYLSISQFFRPGKGGV
jgi:TRAP-type C4-dicarboxylate transport system permease small subunit